VLAGHTRRITALTAIPYDGRTLAITASFDGTVRIWDVPQLREIDRLNLPGPVQAVASADEDHLAVLCCGEVIGYTCGELAPPGQGPADADCRPGSRLT
jgi:WD40 repeat protein